MSLRSTRAPLVIAAAFNMIERQGMPCGVRNLEHKKSKKSTRFDRVAASTYLGVGVKATLKLLYEVLVGEGLFHVLDSGLGFVQF